MATRKRNEWLEADLDDEEDAYNSDNAEESRGKSVAARSTKRRKLDEEESGSEGESDNDEVEKQFNEEVKDTEEAQAVEGEENVSPNPPDIHTTQSPKPKPSLHKRVVKAQDASARSGVVYISRIPPFMKPHTVQHLLAPYAPSGLGRVFLTPEALDQRQSRIRGGGNKKRNFTDGWVEFVSKKEAKIVVETLNTRTIGGKKTGYYVDDVWNLKYLKGFKWRHLTEQITNENAERASRMRADGERERREVREFLQNVERSKVEETRAKKVEAREKKMGAEQSTSGPPKVMRETRDNRSSLRQNKPLGLAKQSSTDKQPEEVSRVLSKIF